VGYRLNHLDEAVFMAVSKPLLTELKSSGHENLISAAVVI